jgi:hypothetical protein
MRGREWLTRFRRSRDAAAVKKAEALQVETPEERAASSGDVPGRAADERTARLAGEASIEDAERLGD